MPTSHPQHQARIDVLMERGSCELVARDYFEAEQTCMEALRKAHSIRDYDRMARILLPLQEARRQKREMAIDAGKVFVVQGMLPEGKQLLPGCYLIVPPRVGVDGRALREIANKRRIPVVVVVREPTTRDGLWPVVSVGLSTVRAKVQPPLAPVRRGKKAAPAKGGAVAAAEPESVVPAPGWFASASEALGDAAIATLDEQLHPALRVEKLIALLDGHPDHEKLHQALERAARAAARDPKPPRRLVQIFVDDNDADKHSNGLGGLN